MAGGYSFGAIDQDKNSAIVDGGFYLNLSYKINELLGGFGIQQFPSAQLAPPDQTALQPVKAPTVDPPVIYRMGLHDPAPVPTASLPPTPVPVAMEQLSELPPSILNRVDLAQTITSSQALYPGVQP